uniref:Uncharacterized protein n=1 Tax=Molossus molossus TaxID=27622 RepID=A0A7J8IZF8_MOLMO|nr:hypothetical protein HJG59_010367 [Molossus molossus]
MAMATGEKDSQVVSVSVAQEGGWLCCGTSRASSSPSTDTSAGPVGWDSPGRLQEVCGKVGPYSWETEILRTLAIAWCSVPCLGVESASEPREELSWDEGWAVRQGTVGVLISDCGQCSFFPPHSNFF